jgi:hypothetical protein
VIRRVTGSAEVRRLLEAAGRQYSTERTRPDGRVIEVRANPVPGGGVVIIYSDVTDRPACIRPLSRRHSGKSRSLPPVR